MSTATKTAEVTGSTPWRTVRRRHFTDDIHSTIQSYGYAGYHGNPNRNYITDEWLDRYASRHGWTVQDVVDFGTSKVGRWVMDQQPMTYKQWTEAMDEYADEVPSGRYRGTVWTDESLEVK